MIVLAFLIFGAFLSASNLMMSPWNLGMGEIVLSLGLPTTQIRAGILDFLEVGASTLARGGYIKLGFGNESIAVSGGYAAFPGISGFFGYAGIRVSGLEAGFGGIYYRSSFGYGGDNDYYVLEGELHHTFRKNGNMKNGIGIHVQNDSAISHPVVSIYFDAVFKKVAFFEDVTVLGGLVGHVRGDFDPFRDMGVVVGLSTSFTLFKR